MAKNVFIVAAETNLDFVKFNPQTFLFVGVERGALDLIKKKIPMLLAIGDFDKVTKEEKNLIETYAHQFISYSSEKDYLDGELAIQKVLPLKPQKIFFVAQPSKRYDKNLSVIDLVFKYNITFINDETMIFLLKKGINTIDYQRYENKSYVSFFAKKPTKITIEKMKYNGADLALDAYENTCISNAFIPGLIPLITNDEDIICILSK